MLDLCTYFPSGNAQSDQGNSFHSLKAPSTLYRISSLVVLPDSLRLSRELSGAERESQAVITNDRAGSSVDLVGLALRAGKETITLELEVLVNLREALGNTVGAGVGGVGLSELESTLALGGGIDVDLLATWDGGVEAERANLAVEGKGSSWVLWCWDGVLWGVGGGVLVDPEVEAVGVDGSKVDWAGRAKGHAAKDSWCCWSGSLRAWCWESSDGCDKGGGDEGLHFDGCCLVGGLVGVWNCVEVVDCD